MIFEAHYPEMLTQARVMFEDENPQITGCLILDSGFKVPVGVGNPEWSSEDGVKILTWCFEPWKAECVCRIEALSVEFVGYNDYATVLVGADLEPGHVFVGRYCLGAQRGRDHYT